MIWPVWVIEAPPAARAMPKSVILTVPSGVTSRFPGFTSRWTMPSVCAAATASAAWATTSAARSGGIGSPPRSRADSGWPGTSSITRNGRRAGTGVVGQLAEVEDRGHVGVDQRGGVAGLGLEPGAEGRVVGGLLLEDLHRDLAVEHGVLGAPDLAHPAGGDPAGERVPLASGRPVLPDHRLHHALGDGAARPLPEIASRATPASSISTATATCGSSAGAKETNQA